jgi:hypothetical protein
MTRKNGRECQKMSGGDSGNQEWAQQKHVGRTKNAENVRRKINQIVIKGSQNSPVLSSNCHILLL